MEESINMREKEAEDDENSALNKYRDSTFVLWYGVNHLTPIVVPVAITMLLSTILVHLVRPLGFVDALEEGMTVYMVYKQEADNTWDLIWQAIVNSLVIVVVIGIMTFGMVLLYKYHCTKVLFGMLYFSTFMAIAYTGWFVFYMACTQYSWPCDLLTSIFVFVNLGVGAVVCVFGSHIPQSLKKTFLVVISCLVCYLLSFFPEWTVWILLIAMALYDICAVLSPCGPLKLLINISRTRDDAIPGLLYETHVDRSDVAHDSPVEEAVKSKETKKAKSIEFAKVEASALVVSDVNNTKEEEEEEEDVNAIFTRESVQLGLGDFIFYSLMVSKAAFRSSVPFVFVFVIVLAGLLITMGLLSVMEMALPALPFSMLLGVSVFLIAYNLVAALVNSAVLHGIVF